MIKVSIAIYSILAVIIQPPFGHTEANLILKPERATALPSEESKLALNPVFFIREQVYIMNTRHKISTRSTVVAKLEAETNITHGIIWENCHRRGVFFEIWGALGLGLRLNSIVNLFNIRGGPPHVCHLQINLHKHRFWISRGEYRRVQPQI